MLLRTNAANLILEDRQVLSLRDAAGMTLHATRGTLWVTQDGDRVDHILQAGDSLVVNRDGRTLVTAVGGSAALSATRREPASWSALWRNLRARIVHGALAPQPARLRTWVHE